MTDIWVCSTCHSINRQRNQKCYKCGARQEDAATGELSDLRAGNALAARTVVRYRSSWLRAVVAAVFILAFAALGIILLVSSLDVVVFLRAELPEVLRGGEIDQAELARRTADVVIPSALRLVSALGALLFFAAWLSRVIMNVPALGGGVPSATPTQAFLFSLLPIVNLIKVPSMVQDAMYRLDPKAGGFFMLVIAWVGLVGSAIASFLVGIWVNLRINSVIDNAQTIDEAVEGFLGVYDIQVTVEVITTIMSSIGAVILVLVIFRIESRAIRRDREIRAAAAGEVGPVSVPVADAGGGTAAVAAAAVAVGPDAPLAQPLVEDPDLAIVGTTVSATSLGAAPAASLETPPAGAAAPVAAAAVAQPSSLPDTDPRIVAALPPTGPHLLLEVGTDDRIRASIDGDRPEVIDLPELRQAADALARAGGRATVTSAATDGSNATLRAAVIETLRGSGITPSES